MATSHASSNVEVIAVVMKYYLCQNIKKKIINYARHVPQIPGESCSNHKYLPNIQLACAGIKSQ